MKRITVALSMLVSVLLSTVSFASPPAPAAATRVAWFDLMVTDLSSTEKFYSSLFGWKVKPLARDYHMIESAGVPVGGIHVVPRVVTGDGIAIYFEVGDIKAKFEEAKKQGATVILEPKNVPSGKGSFALFRDLGGNPVGLVSKSSI